MTKNGKYIYCIILNSVPTEFGPIGIGDQGDMVYTVNYNDISAVVSNSSKKEYRARRVNVLAHQTVLEKVMERFTILPVRFSTVSETDDDAGIQRILEKDYDKFKNLLLEMEGKKELGLKAIAREEVIFNHILEKYSDIRTLRDKLISIPPEKSHAQRMRIGEMVESALQNETEQLKNEILEILRPFSEDVKINENYGDRMIMNGAFLVDKRKETEFDKVVNELDDKYGWLVTLKYVGSLPPYNFVNLIINMEEN
jgi:hypothetical protein